jgi:hypothetical protein
MSAAAAIASGPSSQKPQARDAAARSANAPLDETADGAVDNATTAAAAIAKRAELLLLAQAQRQQRALFRLDRMRADFNARQEEHSEALREMNVLREMAIEQAKKNDEFLKKYITMI